eukprot:TRINITY_DN12825_c0_g2_i2.p1 TRINITY_DN12825_c0_g2~~TRINITY_DN12825_c0_g2_i2.p1  ORF type:complete len:406 (+),score=47.20 TRINITY_DN12825_c0_g2_i2:62-1279(+)
MFKRLRSNLEIERITWRNPQFYDWTLTWEGDQPSSTTTWKVHRNVLVGGTRAALFFVGATREGSYESQFTELSRLLPSGCKAYMERVLDFVYGESLGSCSSQDVMPLLKIADVLQCTALEHVMIDTLENLCHESACVETFLKGALSEFDLPRIAEALVDLVPLSRLTSVDFGALEEIGDINLMRTIARRLSAARMVQWERFAGHGEVIGSSVAINMPKKGSEKSRKGYWCHATSFDSMCVGMQTWRFRIDHIPPCSHGAWVLGFAVANGSHPSVFEKEENCPLFMYCASGAALWLEGTHEGTQYEWSSNPLPHPDEPSQKNQLNQVVQQGSIVSVKLRFVDLQRKGDVLWFLDDALICQREGCIEPVPHHVCIDMYRYDYEPESIGATLIDHAVNCKEACSLADA